MLEPTDFEALKDGSFGTPADALPLTTLFVIRAGEPSKKTISFDVVSGETTVTVQRNDGMYKLNEINTEQSFVRTRTAKITEGDPSSAKIEVQSVATYARAPDWKSKIVTKSIVSCSETSFIVSGELEVFYIVVTSSCTDVNSEEKEILFSKLSFDEVVPRL